MVNTLHSHSLTIPDVANHSVRTQESCCFRNQDSYSSSVKMKTHPSWKRVRFQSETEQQSQNLMDSRFHHNFQNQLSCSPFQEEPLAKSIRDMIQTQNSVTWPISRLDAILSELINMSERILFSQHLTNLYISNSIYWIKESCCFGNQDSISAHLFEHDQNQNVESHIDILASYPFPEIELEHCQ